MRFVSVLVAALVLVAAPVSAQAPREDAPAADIQPRVDHHVQQASVQIQHFEGFVAGDCPRFGSVAEWNAYAEGEINRILLMVAHVQQAWAEAKRTGDDDVRRSAKVPRRRMDEAPQILTKLSACAETNGVTLEPGSIYRRVERELPRRQSEIALPR